jgi:hypothetical protein
MNISSIYSPGPMQPVVDIKENLAIFTQGTFRGVEVVFIEGIPFSRPMYVDFGAVAAGARIAKAAANILRLDEYNLLQLRAIPLDPVSVDTWELSGQARFAMKNVAALIDQAIVQVDPWGAGSTFFIYGKDRDASFGIFNGTGYNLASSYVAFWGFRYLVREIKNSQGALIDPERAPVGTKFTWIPAEGSSAPYPVEKIMTGAV